MTQFLATKRNVLNGLAEVAEVKAWVLEVDGQGLMHGGSGFIGSEPHSVYIQIFMKSVPDIALHC